MLATPNILDLHLHESYLYEVKPELSFSKAKPA